MKLLVFTEGTTTMYASAQNMTRAERVKQSASESDDVKDFHGYVPISNAVAKLSVWKNQGAEIYYLTSRTTSSQIADTQFVLDTYNFPDKQNLLFRRENQTYADVAESLMPDILIEDDCESIGWEVEMTYPHIKTQLKNQIHFIVVKEFEGIDHLPDLLKNLSEYH